ncbi:hypothetical protein COOONC_06402 [Cooperia oncophora]
MKYLCLALGLFALSALSFAEEELSETGQAVLAKIRALKEEEKQLLKSITDEDQKDLYLCLALGLFALSALSFAEEELSETGQAVLAKIRALKEEEKQLLKSITDEDQKDLVESIVDKEEEEEDDKAIATLEKEEKETKEETDEEEGNVREKRAARRRRRGRRGHRGRRLAAHRRRAHRARHRANLRRARRNHKIKKIRALQEATRINLCPHSQP